MLSTGCDGGFHIIWANAGSPQAVTNVFTQSTLPEPELFYRSDTLGWDKAILIANVTDIGAPGITNLLIRVTRYYRNSTGSGLSFPAGYVPIVDATIITLPFAATGLATAMIDLNGAQRVSVEVASTVLSAGALAAVGFDRFCLGKPPQ